MGREYKHSVKGSLTRKLVMIIVISVITLYIITIVLQTTSSQSQGTKTETYLTSLLETSFKGQLQSRSGQIGQKLQNNCNEIKSLFHSLQLLYDGELEQVQSSADERSYYYNIYEYTKNAEKYNPELVYDKTSKFYIIDGKSSAYHQSPDLDTFSSLSESLKQALYYISGLEYIMNATTNPLYYSGFTNGFYYASP